ncbi:MAG: hypothetical protein HYR63_20560 [Proteobacteria bacterium]|nr:hypothetical protein [Pseudomonadota bacterium]
MVGFLRLVTFLLGLSTYFYALPRGWAADELCLDGFCIGQPLTADRFAEIDWLVPKEVKKENCTGIGCQPAVAFRGYPEKLQSELAEALSWSYDVVAKYNVVSRNNLPILRQYRYECNPSARTGRGERRFIGIHRSTPSRYLTVIGLRLIGSELRVYRIVREYPITNQNELLLLARELHKTYGEAILYVDYLSSNAYSDVIRHDKSGWFGRSKLFNPNDLADNAAELVLIDPKTRDLLGPSKMPESGEVRDLPVAPHPQCNRVLPLQ